jgi:[acyl-carrier-protein] S-malonyltransferase
MVMAGLVAIFCSGQGGQHAARFDLVANCPEAGPVFAAAAGVLGQDPRRFVQEAAPADLFSDLFGQILCCTQALAAWFAAIVGLRRPTLEPILARHAVSIAIVDDVDSFVVGGRRTGLEAACQEAAARGARHTVSLKVALPSHTPLLGEATEQFRAVLREASPRLPSAGYRLLSGIDGDTIYDMETGIDKLARQISTTTDWAACLESCRSAGAETALELGPGTALSRMASAQFPDGRARVVEEFHTLAGLWTWLQRAMG